SILPLILRRARRARPTCASQRSFLSSLLPTHRNTEPRSCNRNTEMRVALLADFPVHTLPGFEGRPHGHHATWLPPLARELEARTGEIDLHWITCTKEVTAPTSLRA